MKILSLVIYSIFGLVAGCFIGMGNHTGLVGAFLPGLIAGVLVAGPCIRERSWRMAGVLVLFTLLGSLSALVFPEKGAVKSFCQQETTLYIHAGSYQLGTSSHAFDKAEPTR